MTGGEFHRDGMGRRERERGRREGSGGGEGGDGRREGEGREDARQTALA